MTRTYQFNEFTHNQIQTTAATGDSLRNLASASPLPCAGTRRAMPRSAHLSYLTRARAARSEQRRSSTRTAYWTSPPIQSACRLTSSADLPHLTTYSGRVPQDRMNRARVGTFGCCWWTRPLAPIEGGRPCRQIRLGWWIWGSGLVSGCRRSCPLRCSGLVDDLQ